MSGQGKDDLSRFFRKATQKPEITFNENDWTKLEAMLDKASTKAAASGSLRRKFIVASIVTVLVLSTVTYFVATRPSAAVQGSDLKRSAPSPHHDSTPVTSDIDDKPQSKAFASPSVANGKIKSLHETSAVSLTDSGPTHTTLHSYGQLQNVVHTAMDDVHRIASEHRPPLKDRPASELVDNRKAAIAADDVEPTRSNDDVHAYEIIPTENPVFPRADRRDTVEIRDVSSLGQLHDPLAKTPLARHASPEINTVDEHAIDSAQRTVTPMPDSVTTHDDRPDVPGEKVYQPHWSVLLSLAPDFSSNDFQHLTSPGEAVGITGYYRITPRLNVFAGVIGSNKKYVSYGKEYKPKEDHYWSKHTNGVLPTEIDGSCFMLEIPLGIQYTVLNMKKNRVLVSSMLSNYTMFNESYAYVFPTENPGAAQGWKSKKTTSYPFSVAGVSVSFEHNVSPRLAIGFSPYMKIPLRDMGTWTTMKLYTVGAALTLRYTFQKSKIPITPPVERSD